MHAHCAAAPPLQDTAGEVDALADTLAGLSVKPINVAQPKGPLKGVAAPVGKFGCGRRFSMAGCVRWSQAAFSAHQPPARHVGTTVVRPDHV